MPIAAPEIDAEAIALAALNFVLADEDRLTRFLGLTGLDLARLRDGIADPAKRPAILGAILDHLLAWEPWLLAFAAEIGEKPNAIAAIRRHFPGEPLRE